MAQWQDENLFDVSPSEHVRLKEKVATTLGFRYENINPTSAFAKDVAGVAPWDPVKLGKLVDALEVKKVQPPAIHQEDYYRLLASMSKHATVVNGNMLDWTNGGLPYNRGHVIYWWQDFEKGTKEWDISIERFAGGKTVQKNVDLAKDPNLLLSSMSSVMSMISAVVGKVERGEPVPTWLALAYQSIRITWLMMASRDEITNLKITENIEQHERLRHSELQNLFQICTWMNAMKGLGGAISADKPIDVMKYGLLLGNAKVPFATPPWMKALLKTKQPTLANKLECLNSKDITVKWLEGNKITTMHPEMKTYKQIQSRVKALKGFAYFEKLHTEVNEEMGRRGLGHLPFPIPSNILLDVSILSTAAFTEGERRTIPLYRDGVLADNLHKGMVEVARIRAFEYGFVSPKGSKNLFATPAHWLACGRFLGPPHCHLNNVVKKVGGESDAGESLLRAIWMGDHDVELAKMCAALPGTVDLDPEVMRERLREMFPPCTNCVSLWRTIPNGWCKRTQTPSRLWKPRRRRPKKPLSSPCSPWSPETPRKAT